MMPEDVGLLIILRWCDWDCDWWWWCGASPSSHTPVFLAVHSFSPVSVGVVREHGDGGGERNIATDGGAGDEAAGEERDESRDCGATDSRGKGKSLLTE